jgi:hypothetical protein
VSSPSAELASAPCAGCERPFAGRFCPACGERRLDADDLSLRRYAADAVASVTDVDSTLLRTFRSLIGAPGRLTVDYLEGRRKRAMRPVQLFLVCNVLYFFLQPRAGFNTFTSGLQVHLYGLPYRRLIGPLVERDVAARGIGWPEYELLFDAVIASQARMLVFVMIPLYALLLRAVYPRRRVFLPEHLVFSTHFFAFLLLLFLALNALHSALALADRWLPARVPLPDEPTMVFLLGVAQMAYLVPALYRVHGGTVTGTALRAFALVLGLLVILQTYRFILFFTTFLTV